MSQLCHILNGDSLAYSFPDAKIPGDIIVAREALIDGDLSGESLDEFWRTRARSLEITEAEYRSSVAKEFEKIINAPDHSEFNLWFEYDLFCQVNMWFVISILYGLAIERKVYAVYTSHLERGSKLFWNGFGPANSNELNFCFARRIPLDQNDLQFGEALWKAYKSSNLDELKRLSNQPNSAFPFLKEVVEAHIDRFPQKDRKGRPERVLEDIIKTGSNDFNSVFREFWNRESIYGFGDTQVKQLYEKVLREKI